MPQKADEIVSTVQDDIVSGRLPPGAILRQEHLAHSFRVSRTPVREALKRLHSAGLVSLIPHRGARVRALSLDDVRETFIVRSELEGLAAERAATRWTPTQMTRLRTAERRFARLTAELRESVGQDPHGVAAQWAATDDEFHDVLLEAAGVHLLSQLVRDVRRPFVSQLLAGWNAALADLLATNVRQHRAIRELVEAGSAAGARALMQEHIASSGAVLELAVAHAEAGPQQPRLLQRMSDPFYLRGSEPS